MFSILAPNLTDQKYLSQLIKEMNVKNGLDSAHFISELLPSFKAITRDDLLPLLQKIYVFLQEGDTEVSSKILEIIAKQRFTFFIVEDFRDMVSLVMSKDNLMSSEVVDPLLSLCERVVEKRSDLQALFKDVHAVTDFVKCSSKSNVLKFLAKAAKLEPNIRIPLVFSGLADSLFQSTERLIFNLELLAYLLDNTKSRKYFAEMGHVSQLMNVLFDTNFSDPATKAFRSLLAYDDLTNLTYLQDMLWKTDVPKQIMFAALQASISAESSQNAILCAADCMRYRPIAALPFNIKDLLIQAGRQPAIRPAVLYLWELLSISNPSLLPTDAIIENYPTLLEDRLFCLFISYFSFQSRSNSTFLTSKDSNRHTLFMELVVSSQRAVLHPMSQLLSQSQEDAVLQSLACYNCLVTNTSSSPRNFLVQMSRQFFIDHKNDVNDGKKSLNTIFFPLHFMIHGIQSFNESNIGIWINGKAYLNHEKHPTLIDTAPSDDKLTPINLLLKQRSQIEEYEKLMAKKDELKDLIEQNLKMTTELELDLLEMSLDDPNINM